MRQQLMKGDRCLVSRNTRKVFSQRVVSAEHAAINQNHDGGRGELFGERANIENGVAINGTARRAIGQAITALEHRFASDGDMDQARHLVFGAGREIAFHPLGEGGVFTDWRWPLIKG